MAIGPFTKIVKGDGAEKVVKFSKHEPGLFSLPAQIKLLHHSPQRVNLVLDLDLTLIQAFAVLDPSILPTLKKDPRVKYFPYKDLQMAVVVRPELNVFLAAVSQFADLFVYTHGERSYAKTLVNEFIDPENKYINRETFYAIDKGYERTKTKSLINLFGSAWDRERCIIFDDQIAVWDPSDQSISAFSHFFSK